MGRKNLLRHLIDADTDLPPEPTHNSGAQEGGSPTGSAEEGSGGSQATAHAPAPIRKERTPTRGVGIVGAVSGTFDSLSRELKAAEERLSTGEIVVELATDDIDPSFISDRIGFGKDMEELTASIRDHGQRTPILVRPHPEQGGRYQIAFGHRRYLALKALGRPVRAMIKPLTDDELVIAQGQENNSRVDLTFIERSLFAHRLEGRKFSRATICASLGVDRAAVSRMLLVATAIPDELILAIGAAEKSGRRKWVALAKAFGSIDWEAEREHLLSICEQVEDGDSDRRLDAILTALSNPKPRTSVNPGPPLWVERKPGYVRIRYDQDRFSEEALNELVSQVNKICKKLGGQP